MELAAPGFIIVREDLTGMDAVQKMTASALMPNPPCLASSGFLDRGCHAQ